MARGRAPSSYRARLVPQLVPETSLDDVHWQARAAAIRRTTVRRAILEQVEQLKSNARRASAEAPVKLRIGVIATLLDGVLPDIIKAFTREHTDIELTLHEADSEEGISLVERGELDAALVRPDRAGKFQMVEVSEDHFVAAVPKGHALAKSREIRLEALKGERLIVHRQRRSPKPYESIMRACREAGFTPDLAIQSPTARSQLAAVRSGLGIALVPSFLRDSAVPDIVFRPLTPPIPLGGIVLMWTVSNPRWYLDQLAAMIGVRLGGQFASGRKPKPAARRGRRRAGGASS